MLRFTKHCFVSALLLTVIITQVNTATAAGSTAVTPPPVAPEVKAALAWTLPANTCNKPKPPGVRKAIFDSQGISREEWDVDYYTLKRYNRKEQRWQQCVDGYKNDLKKEFQTLRKSASFGLTKAQADIILGKMKVIQTVMESAEGLPPTGVPTSGKQP